MKLSGVNDVSWNSPQAPTPHLASLARTGVILDSAYTLPICSPSRAAMLTGVYPFRLGLQRGFGQQVPEGIPTDIRTLPEYLRRLGYQSHMFGKEKILYIYNNHQKIYTYFRPTKLYITDFVLLYVQSKSSPSGILAIATGNTLQLLEGSTPSMDDSLHWINQLEIST